MLCTQRTGIPSPSALQRIADPYWFQAFSRVLGFDRHSLGTTTATCGALTVAIDPEEMGIAVAGGKGERHERRLMRSGRSLSQMHSRFRMTRWMIW
ncbi:MAG: DUF763 domain-containing protein [Euryarchaeota archaeon]|nr:DUF763 domain-containing protein [Euryarchaeota archaeon]